MRQLGQLAGRRRELVAAGRRARDSDSSGFACASHGSAATIVAGSCGMPVARSRGEALGRRAAPRSSAANAVLRVLRGRSEQRDGLAQRSCCWAAVARIVVVELRHERGQLGVRRGPGRRWRGRGRRPSATARAVRAGQRARDDRRVAQRRRRSCRASRLSACAPVRPRTDGSRLARRRRAVGVASRACAEALERLLQPARGCRCGRASRTWSIWTGSDGVGDRDRRRRRRAAARSACPASARRRSCPPGTAAA